ncbi:hypothetical protein U9S86_004579 [Salmonella enterica]|nr:hypothetical protein [Salmonella enterica]EHA9546194.1 hypothetical protein [Salmonella enterica subsp. enterica serovar Braenderup]EHP7123066.1 hypothetical protein [Salmonella enterica subsp. enterica serovar Thompson]EBH4941575.1 hypothetical protein [Salmonella enterica]ECK3278499.1 hypothetical protein [Salmonella enterica]
MKQTQNEIRLDLAVFSPDATNRALELLFKARYNGDGNGDEWTGDELPFIKRVVSAFLKRGKERLKAFKEDLLGRMTQEVTRTFPNIERPVIKNKDNWTEKEMDNVEFYLESLANRDWDFEDHALSIDLAWQRALKPDDVAEEAVWLATKSTLLGKVAANWQQEEPPTEKQQQRLADELPGKPEEVRAWYPLPRNESRALDFAAHHAAENITNLSDKARKQMREIIFRHLQKRQNGDFTGQSLKSELFDTFGELNRDWTRIAVTEAGECFLQGMIMGMTPGTQVKRVEHFDTACTFCRQIDGVIATVVAADAPNKDPNTMIWPGKNNIGRSAAPRKRVGGALVPRSPEEMWWLPAGLAHPHCRGNWVRVEKKEEPEDPEFTALLAQYLS